MKHALFIALLVLATTLRAEEPVSWTEAMKAADTDGDGQVSMNEVREFKHQKEFIGFQPFMADHFIDLDTDNDGMVSNEELQMGIMKMGLKEEEISHGFRQGFDFMPKD